LSSITDALTGFLGSLPFVPENATAVVFITVVVTLGWLLFLVLAANALIAV
jgi:hypothetical protein